MRLLKNVFNHGEEPKKFISSEVLSIVKILGITLVDAQTFLYRTGFNVTESDSAVYDPTSDIIAVKNVKSLGGEPDTYVLHEIIHWTGHSERLNREVTHCPIRSVEMLHTEEACAQLGMYILCQRLGICSKQSSVYLDNYIAIYTAADIKKARRDAYKAVDFIMECLEGRLDVAA